MPEVRVKNFGPIAKASFELKPLTVFIGPNGTGKSYLALAAYCLFRTLAERPHLVSIGHVPALFSRRGRPLRYLPSRISEEAKKAWPDADSVPRTQVNQEDLPAGLQEAIQEFDNEIGEALTSDFALELERCYGTRVSDLSRRGPVLGTPQLEIEILDMSSKFNWGVLAANGALATKTWKRANSSKDIDLPVQGSPIQELVDEPDYFLIQSLYGREPHVPRELALRAHYMPASRSGIMMGHKTLAGLLVGHASRAWVQPIEIPRLPGVVTDLIQALLLLERRAPPDSKLQAAISYLEGNVAKGAVDIESVAEYPEVYYENESGKYSLHQASSMVAEIAPIVLYLKYLVRPGQLFIIEEPESHIDADNQRRLARAIAMLVNAGVKVLITTHSDFFVDQLNNLLLLSSVSPRRRAARRYTAREVLSPSAVGAYFFRPGDEGTTVETLEVTAEGGIPAEQFSDIHIATYDEAIALEHPVT